MNRQEMDPFQLLLAFVGSSGVYALLAIVSLRGLTIIEVAILLQTVCVCCGVAGLLLISRHVLQR
jgi:hypothetical protein